MPQSCLVLNAAALEQALPFPSAIAAMERAFGLGASGFDAPLRTHIPLPDTGATFLVMPARASDALGIKLLGVYPLNPASGLPFIQACYVLFSALDGRLLALMDGTYLTAARTAATSALATRLLAREDAAELAIFGTGKQAEFHLLAMPHVRPVSRARICGLNDELTADFVRRVRGKVPFPVEPATAEDAATADIICTCTNSPTPVFPGRCLNDGAHINAIGAFQPHTRELDDDVFRNARIVVDTTKAALTEAGDLLIPLASARIRTDQIAGDLFQLSRGEIRGRESQAQVTVFKSVGFALEDLAAASSAYDTALANSIGTRVEF